MPTPHDRFEDTDPLVGPRGGRAPALAVVPDRRPPVDRDTHELALQLERMSTAIEDLTTGHAEFKTAVTEELKAHTATIAQLKVKVGKIRAWPTGRELGAMVVAVVTVLSAIAQMLHGQIPVMPQDTPPADRIEQHSAGVP